MVESIFRMYCSLPLQLSAAVLQSLVLVCICTLTAQVLTIARPNQARAKAVQQLCHTIVATGGR